MPTPGSPERRIAAPGTMPPPSTRSNSPMPVGQCSAGVVSMLVIGRAARSAEGLSGAGARPPMPVVAADSTTVFHAWHSPHRPTHFVLAQPHSVQRYAVVDLAMTSPYGRRPTVAFETRLRRSAARDGEAHASDIAGFQSRSPRAASAAARAASFSSCMRWPSARNSSDFETLSTRLTPWCFSMYASSRGPDSHEVMRQ